MGVLVPVVDHVGLGRPVIAISEPGARDARLLVMRRTRRPALRLEVPDVEELVGPDRPAGIAAHVGLLLPRHMALLAGQDEPPARLHLSGFFAPEDIEQAAAGHVGRHLEPRRLEKGWSYIGQADEIIDRPAARHLRPPAQRQPDARAGVVEVALGAGKGQAVVTGHEDDRIVELAVFLERGYRGADQAVEALHLPIVIRHIASNLGDVRKAGRDDDIIDLHAALLTRALAKGPVGVAGSKPEAEGLLGRHR